MATFWGTIGSNAYSAVRMQKLKRLKEAGYRGMVSVTAYFATDIYEITDDHIVYQGRFRYGTEGFMIQNFNNLYSEWVTRN